MKLSRKNLNILFDNFNIGIFDGKLPKVNVYLSKKDSDMLGCLFLTGSASYSSVFKKYIKIYMPSVIEIAEEDGIPVWEMASLTLLHEMVHLLQVETIKGQFFKLSYKDQHDRELFDLIGEKAVRLGLILDSDLL